MGWQRVWHNLRASLMQQRSSSKEEPTETALPEDHTTAALHEAPAIADMLVSTTDQPPTMSEPKKKEDKVIAPNRYLLEDEAPLPIAQLPLEIIERILSHLADADVCQFRLVSSYCRDVVEGGSDLPFRRHWHAHVVRKAVAANPTQALDILLHHEKLYKRIEGDQIIWAEDQALTQDQLEVHDETFAALGMRYALRGQAAHLRLEHLRQLRALDLRRAVDEGFLGWPRRVQWLTLERMSHCPTLSYLECLHHVDLDDNYLETLDGRQLPPSLQTLHLRRNQLTKVEHLDHLVSLRHLDLGQNARLHPMAIDFRVLPSLTYLDLSDTAQNDDTIYRLDALRLPSSLESLFCNGISWFVTIGDLRRYATLRRLEVLRCERRGWSIKDDQPLLPRSLKAFIGSNTLSDHVLTFQENLADLIHLERLDMHRVADPLPLQSLPSLERVSIAFYDYPRLVSMASTLRELIIEEGRMCDMAEVTLPPSLVVLRIRKNLIASLKNVSFPPTLQQLDLSGNRIHGTIENLPPSLRYVDLSFNAIKGIHFKTCMPYLHTLNLSENRISSIAHVRPSDHLVALRELDLHTNWLESLADLTFSASLCKLNLVDNPIRFDEVRDCSFPPSLTTVVLSDERLKESLRKAGLHQQTYLEIVPAPRNRREVIG